MEGEQMRRAQALVCPDDDFYFNPIFDLFIYLFFKL